MRKIPNFVLLRAFEAAARLQSFTLAAHELHLTPSAISHQVRELEEYFCRPLFIRRNRRVETTYEGRRLFQNLARVFDTLEATCAEVTLAPRAQVLAIHCVPSLAINWLGPRLTDFMKAHPEVVIRLQTVTEEIDLTQVRDIDVEISYGYAQERSGIDVVALGKERIVPLCSPALIRSGVPAGEQLESLTLIDSQFSQVTWRDWFALNGLTFPARPRPSFDRGVMAISAAADGVGVALESTRLAERQIERGELVELGADVFKPVARETHFFSQRSNEQHVEKIRVFREWLLAHIAREGALSAP